MKKVFEGSDIKYNRFGNVMCPKCGKSPLIGMKTCRNCNSEFKYEKIIRITEL